MHGGWSVTAVAATVLGVGLSAGCATAPAGPSVMVLPGTGQPFDQFQADVHVCRDWAAKQVKGAFMDAPSFEVQRRYDNAYIQCMYAKGHQVPGRDLPARTPAPPTGSAPPPPPQTPPK
jgi:hypothetical protein